MINLAQKVPMSLIRVTLCLLCFTLSESLIDASSSSSSSTAWAQEGSDPFTTIEQAIAEGKKHVKSAGARKYRGRSKSRVNNRVKLYLKALESFSAALRPVDSYYLEDENEELYQEVNAQMDEVLKKPEVQKKIAGMRSDLIKALAADRSEEAMQIVQTLISIDERDAKMKYLIPILSTQLP